MRLRTGKKEAGKTGCGEAEDTVGLTPVKDGNDVRASFFPSNFTGFQVLRLSSRGAGWKPVFPEIIKSFSQCVNWFFRKHGRNPFPRNGQPLQEDSGGHAGIRDAIGPWPAASCKKIITLLHKKASGGAQCGWRHSSITAARRGGGMMKGR